MKLKLLLVSKTKPPESQFYKLISKTSYINNFTLLSVKKLLSRPQESDFKKLGHTFIVLDEPEASFLLENSFLKISTLLDAYISSGRIIIFCDDQISAEKQFWLQALGASQFLFGKTKESLMRLDSFADQFYSENLVDSNDANVSAVTDRDQLRYLGEKSMNDMNHSPKNRKIFPKLGSTYLKEMVFGYFWNNTQLPLQLRMHCILSALATHSFLPQLRSYIRSSLNVGISPSAIQQNFLIAGFFSGCPAYVNGQNQLIEELAERGQVWNNFDWPDYSFLEKEQRGIKLRKKYQLTSAFQDQTLSELTNVYLFGDLWYHPGMNFQERELCLLLGLLFHHDVAILNRVLKCGYISITKSQFLQYVRFLAPYIGFSKADSYLKVIACK